jgi:hypothetical protein
LISIIWQRRKPHKERKTCGGSHGDLQEYLGELKQWFAFRERIPRISDIVRMWWRTCQNVWISRWKPSKLRRRRKRDAVGNRRAVEKSVGKLLFGLKDTLRHSLWKECLDAVYDAASRDTLKS